MQWIYIHTCIPTYVQELHVHNLYVDVVIGGVQYLSVNQSDTPKLSDLT